MTVAPTTLYNWLATGGSQTVLAAMVVALIIAVVYMFKIIAKDNGKKMDTMAEAVKENTQITKTVSEGVYKILVWIENMRLKK